MVDPVKVVAVVAEIATMCGWNTRTNDMLY